MHTLMKTTITLLLIARKNCVLEINNKCLIITVSSRYDLVCCFTPGNDKPRVSTTDDMVFAVNIPPSNNNKNKSLLMRKQWIQWSSSTHFVFE